MPEVWSWLGDHLAIDVANTVVLRRGGYVDLVAEPDGWATWLHHEAVRLPTALAGHDDRAGSHALTALRDHVLALLRAAAAGDSLPRPSIEAVNAVVQQAPPVRVLGPGGELEMLPAAGGEPSAQLRGLVAAAVVDLLTGPDRTRLALCPAPGCGQLYLRSRTNQRWCGDACGNRARGARHHSRHQRRTPA